VKKKATAVFVES